jgi:hypothetical protein
MSEMKLKTDILASTNTGLASEKEHLMYELRQTKQLLKTYEVKYDEVSKNFDKTTEEYQELKKNMISFNEVTRARDIKIEKLQNMYNEKAKEADELET